MSNELGRETFPPDFPPGLAGAAFVTGEEAAWPTALASSVVKWLGTHGYAVLGTELWILQEAGIQTLPIGSTGGREIHGNTVNRKNGEEWDVFVTRSAHETSAYLQSFNEADILERGKVYFNVVWVTEAELNSL